MKSIILIYEILLYIYILYLQNFYKNLNIVDL